MRNTFKTILLHFAGIVTGGVLFLATPCLAAPNWCENTPKHDSEYKNYVGRAAAAALDQAFRDAVVAARKEAVEENFGFQYSVNSAGNRKASSTAASENLITQDFEERTKSVSLDGFERVDTYSNDSSSGTSVCVWFRYPVKAIEKEVKRLASLKVQGTPARAEMVIQGSIEDKKRGVVIINSTPPGAKVTIDAQVWGETPLEIRGKLKQGSHHLLLDHPDYERVTKTFETFEGETNRISEILKRAVAHVTIRTEPEGAMVMIDGRYVGASPIGPIDVDAGAFVTVVIEHPEAKRYEQRIQLERGDLWDKTITLELKKAHLSFTVDPKDADLQMDHESVDRSAAGYTLELAAGSHSLHLERDGFENLDKEMDLRGGEISDLGTVRMKKKEFVYVAPVKPKTDYSFTEPERAPAATSAAYSHWLFNLNLYEGASSPVKNPSISAYRFGVGLEYYPFWLIGLRASYLLGVGSRTYSDGIIDYTGNTLEVGVPIHFLWFHLFGKDSLFVEPVASATSFNYTARSRSSTYGDGTGKTTANATILSTGVDFGYRVLSTPNPGTSKSLGFTIRYGIDRDQHVTGGYQGQPIQKMGFEVNFGF